MLPHSLCRSIWLSQLHCSGNTVPEHAEGDEETKVAVNLLMLAASPDELEAVEALLMLWVAAAAVAL